MITYCLTFATIEMNRPADNFVYGPLDLPISNSFSSPSRTTAKKIEVPFRLSAHLFQSNFLPTASVATFLSKRQRKPKTFKCGPDIGGDVFWLLGGGRY